MRILRHSATSVEPVSRPSFFGCRWRSLVPSPVEGLVRQCQVLRPSLVIVLAIGLAIVGTLLGCHAACKPACASQSQPAAAAPRPAPAPQGWAGTMGHAELWAQTCNRCHYAWSPDQLSPAQWEVVMHHMRLRANLTGDEQKAILEFLQSASR